jgi:hypothetical protein
MGRGEERGITRSMTIQAEIEMGHRDEGNKKEVKGW